MKTSEFILSAIDSELAGSPEEFAPSQEGVCGKHRFLCLVFSAHANRLNISVPAGLTLAISEDLNGCSVFCWGYEGWQDQESYDLRFMYAEFLAYYFESIGD